MTANKSGKFHWATDLHLDHGGEDPWSPLIEAITRHRADGFLISGDIAEATTLESSLDRLASQSNLPIFFVLGNHDFYGSGIGETRQSVSGYARQHPKLNYLTDQYPIELGPHAFLVGEDGWGDATLGDYEKSFVRLRDFERIDDFASVPSHQWRDRLVELGKQSAIRLADKLQRLPDHARHVLVLTHVPPFREACWYEGQTTDDHWAPFFVCGEVGRCLQAVAKEKTDVQFTVLCGHTHHAGVAKLEDNLVIHTGSASLGAPTLEATVTYDGSAIEILRH